jgi:hypothetical protein
MMYAQNAVVVNEFLGKSWNHVNFEQYISIFCAFSFMIANSRIL